MLRTGIGTVLTGLALLSAFAPQADAQQPPPTPAPAVPPPPPAPGQEAPAPPPPPGAPAPAVVAPSSAPAPEFSLGNKKETIAPLKHHDGLSEGGKIDIKAEGSTLTLTMTGAAAAHCFVGCESTGGQRFCLTQEFEITSATPGMYAADVALESTLKGYVRGRHKATGCMRLASAAIYPAGGPVTPLCISYPAACAPGGCAYKYDRQISLPATTLPLGRYVLVANFFIVAEANGFTNAHGVADFSSDDLPDAWQQSTDPFKDVDRKDFGFVVTLTAAAPGASGQAKKDKPGINQANRPQPTPAPAPSDAAPSLTATTPEATTSR